jgi:proton-translocating NAD(P)+ transhydrogenase subunit alpha
VNVGVPKETAQGERRVALVPEAIRRLPPGVEVVLERGAGAEAGFPDEAYSEAGASVVDDV